MYPYSLKPWSSQGNQRTIVRFIKFSNRKRSSLNIIKHTPSYAKFLKDLYIVKRKLKVQKKAFLIKHVSFIKCKAPGCPTIYCIIGDYKIERALLDLSAIVNLLPYSMYWQLNFGELKPASTILLLVDRSIKVLRGIIEDVLVTSINSYILWIFCFGNWTNCWWIQANSYHISSAPFSHC